MLLDSITLPVLSLTRAKVSESQETASFAEQLDAAGFHNAANAVVDMSKN